VTLKLDPLESFGIKPAIAIFGGWAIVFKTSLFGSAGGLLLHVANEARKWLSLQTLGWLQCMEQSIGLGFLVHWSEGGKAFLVDFIAHLGQLSELCSPKAQTVKKLSDNSLEALHNALIFCFVKPYYDDRAHSRLWTLHIPC